MQRKLAPQLTGKMTLQLPVASIADALRPRVQFIQSIEFYPRQMPSRRHHQLLSPGHLYVRDRHTLDKHMRGPVSLHMRDGAFPSAVERGIVVFCHAGRDRVEVVEARGQRRESTAAVAGLAQLRGWFGLGVTCVRVGVVYQALFGRHLRVVVWVWVCG